MYHRLPDAPTSVGCLVGFFALFPAAFSALAFWGAHKAFTKAPPLPDVGKKLIVWGILALVPAVLGIAFCIYRIATTGKRDYVRSGTSLSS